MHLRLVQKPLDFIVTLLLWVYFIMGSLGLFIPYLIWNSISSGLDERAYQRRLHIFFQGFFALLKFLSLKLSIQIDPSISSLRSSVIVSNHISYLDPLLMIASFEKQKTIVKNTFYSVPLFAWLLRKLGYIPSVAKGKSMALVIRHVGSMKEYLKSGGNLFVFPEGTRSRNGQLNEFNKGAFTIAIQCQAPVNVVFIKNTGVVFKPGSYLFNTRLPKTIEMELLGTLHPQKGNKVDSAGQLMEEAKKLLNNRLLQDQYKS
jgi:1-acyl-sn-glycerol-3-phosphate acyltransferase